MPPRFRTPLFLLTLTLLAAVPRLLALGTPPLWGDEALVYWRTCGTFGQLLDVLRGDGFPPLHYELYWLIVHAVGHAPPPWAMRFVPAICGTLTVPAVYFAARQLLGRPASRLAAIFTAGSAFALFYSRDAKMYAEAWMAMTLSVGCLLWWARTGSPTAWLAWVATAAAAAGSQSLTLIPTAGLGGVVLLSGRRPHWRTTLVWLAGLTLIAAGPAGYYIGFNRWATHVDTGGWSESGLAWVNVYNHGRSGPAHVRYLATTFLTGWEWPRPDVAADMPGLRLHGLQAVAVLVVAIITAGLWPWRRTDDDAPQPPWRSALWLAAWAVPPVYGFYRRSVPDAGRLPWWIGPALGAIVFAAGLWSRRQWRPPLAMAAVAVGVVGACQLVAIAMPATAGRSVWVPRYMGFAWPAVAIAAGAMLARLPTAVRWPAVAVVLAVNVGLFAFRLLGTTEPPVARMAADVASASADTLVVTRLPFHPTWQAGPTDGDLYTDAGRYYLQRLLDRRPMSPAAFKAILADVTVANGNPARLVPRRLTPAVRHVIVWDRLNLTDDAEADPLLPRLTGWHRSADDQYTVRDAWTTADAHVYRRRTYDR